MYGSAPATQNGREKAAPNKDPAASAETVHAAMAPFQTTANEALLARSASNKRPRGMSISSVSPRALTVARAPGGSPPDLPAPRSLPEMTDLQAVHVASPTLMEGT